MRPLAGRKFGTQPIGVNKLNAIVKNMCKEARFEGKFLNHYGKRTCATTLYQAVDYGKDWTSQYRCPCLQQTVRAYNRPSEAQQVEISRALECGKSAIKSRDRNTR
ncbi:uncharacterized protein LOC110457980 [Mizuhopecten yessoensis]|uniref:uncharacterized protein LOC110457980 n=1 Tax=Mizuhopecten yessoensis TaxID=6573 RepID=UPI000B45B11E|nr:uncharacterized protein LOC110457980 [Mizuhopecten yessoensis]